MSKKQVQSGFKWVKYNFLNHSWQFELTPNHGVFSLLYNCRFWFVI
jgi:hypothetical protein